MATEVQNNIIGVEKATTDLTNALKPHVEMLGKTVQMYAQWNAQLTKIPSEYLNNLNNMAAANERIVNSQKKVVDSTKELERARLAEIRLQQQREKAFDNYEKQLKREEALVVKKNQVLERSVNFYNRVQDRVNELSRSYNDLALKQQLGMKLTTSEIAQLDSLTKRLNTYQSALIKVDSVIQKNQRRVGDYASGWNGLSNSINQITRELPAFTFSAQTGFLALSNNIPILVDEIQRVSKSVAELRAQGKQVPGVMSQILSSFLSWQTVLSVGVTLITVYGKEIGQFFSEMFKGSKVIESTTKLLDSYNQTLKDGDYEKAFKDVAKVAISFEQAKKGVITKKEALEIYNNVLGDVMGKTNDFAKAENTFNLQARNYVEATMAKAQANILLSESAKLAAENVELQNRKELSWGERLKGIIQTGGIFGQLFSSSKDLAADKALENRNKLIETNTKQINANKAAAEELVKRFQSLSNSLSYGTLFTDEKKPDKQNKIKDTSEKDLREALELEYNLQVARINQMEEGQNKELELLQAWYDYQKELHKDNKKQLLITELDYWTKLLDIQKKAYDKENADFIKSNSEKEKEYEEWEKEYLKGLEEFEKSKQYWRDWEADKVLKVEEEKADAYLKTQEKLRSILASSFDNLGFGSLSALFDENLAEMWKNTQSTTEKMAIAFQVFGSIVGDVFNQMKASSDQYYENEYNKLEKEKEVALKYAGENTAGREAIEQQYNERVLQIKREQAKREKQLAIFQANINIATGVISAIAQADMYPFNFVLAGLITALGIAQLATINAQPLPAFWKGTQNAPEGWAIVDELRPEIHTDKKGNIKSTGSKKGANLRYLEKGDKIFPSHDAFFREMNTELNMSGSFVDRNGSLHIDTGLSKEDLREVMKETIGSQSKTDIMFDVHGFTKRVTNGYNRTLIKKRSLK